MVKRSLCFFIIILIAFFTSCSKNCGCGPIPESIYGDIFGKWQWIKTTTPTKTILAKDVGYTRSMEVVNDRTIGASKIVFFKNDSLETNFLISRILNESWEEKSILLKYNGDAQLKIFRGDAPINDHYDIEISEIMPEYSIQADTVRHFYHFVKYLE